MSSYNVVMVELIIQCPLVKGQVVVLDAHSFFVVFLGLGWGGQDKLKTVHVCVCVNKRDSESI